MHILFLSTGYPTIYAPLDMIFAKDQAEALTEAGHEVGLISVNPISIKSVLKTKKWNMGLQISSSSGLTVYLHTYLNIPKLPLYSVQQAVRKGVKLFEKYIQEKGKPEIIHVQCFESGLLAKEIEKKWGIPYVVTEHSSRFLKNSLAEKSIKVAKEVFACSRINIAVSETFKKILEKQFQVPFKYIPNVVDSTAFRKINRKKETKPFTWLHIAALDDNKNQPFLIQEFKSYKTFFPDAHLKIIGSGFNEKNIKELANQLGLNNSIEFLGYLSRREIMHQMKQANAFVLSSKMETFGVVLIEALSAGLPVVSTRCGGPESIIKGENIGVLVEQKEGALTEGMKTLTENYAQFQSDNLKQYVDSNFSKEAVAARLEEIYKEALR